jgi:hypothetical protein
LPFTKAKNEWCCLPFLQYLGFLERLGRALNMDEISKDVGVDLHTDSLLARAEQLARLESEKLVDKVSASFNMN